MPELVKTLLLICPLIFLGGFVDSVAGGGGLITLPAYMMAGVPVHFAAGTNKVVNGCGSATASVKFFRSGKIRVHAALCAALDVGRRLGVTVTPSLLMNPVKSVTAVIGLAHTPQPARIRGCAYCNLRETCQFRKEGKTCGA